MRLPQRHLTMPCTPAPALASSFTVTAGPGIVQPRKRHNREFSIDRQRAIESPALIGGARELSRSGLTDRRARPFVRSCVNKLAAETAGRFNTSACGD